MIIWVVRFGAVKRLDFGIYWEDWCARMKMLNKYTLKSASFSSDYVLSEQVKPKSMITRK